ncbi:tetratricopeptide repeat protein [Novosphingobium sp.]|uniref:tetratricopeptide repeat protein n=1 Tax=Novosphingobium sp. TaxID=1874826 RepID=UPI003BABF000
MPDASALSVAGRIRRAVMVLGLMGLAIAALLSGTDRESREFPNSPSYVGWPYDTGAARAKAILAFVQRGPQRAIGYARRAVISDPISAQAISILGQAQLYSQHLAEAHAAFRVSGQLGWRDSMTQIYWLDQALQDGDYKVAAERLDALLRQAPTDENRDRFITAVASTPEGRAALADRLKLTPIWAREMVSDVNGLPADQIQQRVDIMRVAGKGVWDCGATENITQSLIKLNQLDVAQEVWRLNCETSSSLVYDGSFEQFDTMKPTTGFDWQLSNRGDAAIALLDDGAGRRSLALEVTAAVTLPIIRQLVVLKPGRYRLTWQTPQTASAQAAGLSVSLACKPDLSTAVSGKPVDGKPGMWSADFMVDAECPARQLVFWLAPKAPIRLDDVSLVAAKP